MRTITFVLLAILLMVSAPFSSAQVTNLTILGSPSNFTFVSGSNFSWAYDVPAGDTATCEIWIDANQNGVIDPGIDRLYMNFLQADGVMNGLNGPPDIDGLTNGHVVFQSPVGIAPGNFVMKFTDRGTSMQMPGTCTPLASPAYTVSGKVTVPTGYSAQYLALELSKGNGNNFWHAITNANGDFVIQMDSDTSGGQWHLKIMSNPVPGGVLSPEDYWVYPGLNPAGRDFSIQAPAAKIAGIVVDENGRILPDWQISLNRNDGGIRRSVNAGPDGSYQVGALGVELNGVSWFVQAGNGDPMFSSTLMAQRQLPVLNGGDSLYRRLVVYTPNSGIQGQIKINGNPPGYPVQLAAMNADTAQGVAMCDPGTGNFSIPVSDKIYNYTVFAFNLGQNFNMPQVLAHPGDTGVILSVTMTSVEDPTSAIPQHFALEQNYPNPFNPTTGIRFQVPGVSDVRLAVYNILGQQVALLVNEAKQPGAYTVQFDASNLPSGFYFYRMTAGSFSSTKSMIVLK
jgi:hypothetical protein